MADWKGLKPTTYADWCLGRIATALEAIAAATAPPAEEPGTPLPEDFPGREVLAEAGVLYLERVPRKGYDLAALGLDGPTVNRVMTWLKVNG